MLLAFERDPRRKVSQLRPSPRWIDQPRHLPINTVSEMSSEVMGNLATIGLKSTTEAGDGITTSVGRWSFGGDVSEKFDNHVSKSVPLYNEGHRLILSLSDFFIKSNSVCYELGSSTGALIAKLSEKHRDLSLAQFIGLDVESAMVAHARSRHAANRNLSFQQARVEEYEFMKSDLIVSYYTIQFIHPKWRQVLFDKIYNSLEWGGAFLLFEKVRANDARFQDIITILYNDFKLSQGYTCDEIISKSSSLKGILEPFSTEANREFLYRAGFKDVVTIQKYLCFEGILAIK